MARLGITGTVLVMRHGRTHVVTMSMGRVADVDEEDAHTRKSGGQPESGEVGGVWVFRIVKEIKEEEETSECHTHREVAPAAQGANPCSGHM